MFRDACATDDGFQGGGEEGAFTRENYRRLRARRSIKKEEKKPLRPVASANHMLKWLSPDNTLSR